MDKGGETNSRHHQFASKWWQTGEELVSLNTMARLETQLPFNSRDIFPAFYISPLTSWKCCKERSLAPALARTRANTGVSLSELNLVNSWVSSTAMIHALAESMRNGREIAPCHDSDPAPVRPATQGRAAPRSTSAWPSPPSGPVRLLPLPSLFRSIFACFFQLHVFLTFRTLCFCFLVILFFVVLFSLHFVLFTSLYCSPLAIFSYFCSFFRTNSV